MSEVETLKSQNAILSARVVALEREVSDLTIALKVIKLALQQLRDYDGEEGQEGQD